MPSDDEPVNVPPAEPLQFDHADFTEAAAAPALACAACQRPIADVYYEIGGKTLCGVCSERVTAHFTGGSGPARFLRALLLGGLAAAAGTLLYLLVLATTGYQVGLIAILVGYMVGASVRKGARYRGGLAYQLLAVFLTYTSIVASYVPLIVAEVVKQGKAERAAVAGAETGPATVKAKDETPREDQVKDQEDKSEKAQDVAKAEEPRPAPVAKPAPQRAAGPKPGVAQFFLVFVILLGLAYAAPFMAGARNLLGMAIIFFGLLQAWRMNRRVPLAINGPFQVGGGPPPPQELPAHA
jgi:hypothetical protein